MSRLPNTADGENPSVLITGASGRIGVRLVKVLKDSGWRVSILSSSNPFPDVGGIEHIYHEWGNPFETALPHVDVVYHLAAQTSSYVARSNVTRDVKANVLGSVELLEALAQTKAKPIFVFAGSVTEYGLTDSEYVHETTPLKVETFYDAAKIATELYGQQFASEGWLSKFITLRLPNVYGDISAKQSTDRGFLDKSVRRALQGEPLTYFGTGEYKRDFLHVDDVVEAMVSAYVNSKTMTHPVYNLGTGIGTTLRDALEMIANKANQVTGLHATVLQAEFPLELYPIERRNSIVDARLFQSETSWRPKVTLAEGINTAITKAWGLMNEEVPTVSLSTNTETDSL